MTQQDMLEATREARVWIDKAEADARQGNLSGAYTMLLLAKDVLHQGIRDYSDAKQESEEAA